MSFRVLVVAPGGAVTAAVGRLGDGSGDLQSPKGVASDSEGHLYVVDALFDKVQIFDREGRLLLAFGAGGGGPGQFSMPAGLTIDSHDLLFVADSFNRRVQVFRYLPERGR